MSDVQITEFTYVDGVAEVTARWLDPRTSEDAVWQIVARVREDTAHRVSDYLLRAARGRFDRRDKTLVFRCWDNLPHDAAVALAAAVNAYETSVDAAAVALAEAYSVPLVEEQARIDAWQAARAERTLG